MKKVNTFNQYLYARNMMGHIALLNLKNLNNTMPYVHFKMETLQSTLNLIAPNRYLASIDLKDACYTVPIYPDYSKYLKFFWKGQLYKFLLLPNGLCSGPRKCTKLMKPPIAILRVAGHIIAIYIDDLINVGLTYKECLDNIEASINLLQSLVKYSGAHYRRLEYDKVIALKKHQGSFDAKMTISTEAVCDLKW